VTIPSQADIKKREDKLKEFMKRLNEDGSPQEKHVVAVVRSAIRQAWMKSDVKLAYLYSRTIPDMDDSTRTKWLVRCEICEGLFKLSDVEVDHKYAGNKYPFTKVEHFQDYFDNILMVNFDGLQVLCKEGCHRTKSLSESLNISFNDAKIEREVIKICKLKAAQIDKWLGDRGIKVAKNPQARRDAVRQCLTEEKENVREYTS
jgi:hypothetical protein